LSSLQWTRVIRVPRCLALPAHVIAMPLKTMCKENVVSDAGPMEKIDYKNSPKTMLNQPV